MLGRPATALPRPFLILLTLAALAAGGLIAPIAARASCPATFEVPIERESGVEPEPALDDEVIVVVLAARVARPLRVTTRATARATRAAECGRQRRTGRTPGFGVFPGRGTLPRRIFDERRGQAQRDGAALTDAPRTSPRRSGSRR